MTDTVLIADVVAPGPGLDAQRLERRARLLARRGGGALIAPVGAEGPLLVPGVRHWPVEVPPGLAGDRRAAAVAERLAEPLERLRPRLIHVLGLPTAIPALLRQRTGAKVVIEPGVTPAHWLRDHQPDLPAARLADLVALEDKTLRHADAVIARSVPEAAALVRRGVESDNIYVVLDALPEVGEPDPLRELPQVMFIGDTCPWSGWALTLEALARVRVPWRLTVVLPPDVSAGQIDAKARALNVSSRVSVLRQGDDLALRLAGVLLVVCPLLSTKATEAASVVPEAVLWALASGRPLVAADLPVVRAYAGGGARYFDAGDAGSLADALREMLLEGGPREAVLAEAGPIRARLLAAPGDTVVTDLWDVLLDRTAGPDA